MENLCDHSSRKGAHYASPGRVHVLLRGWMPAWTCSEADCFVLLPAGSSTAAPGKADLNPKDWDSTTPLYPVPSQLLEE